MIIQTISIKSVTAQGMGTLSVFEGSHDVPFDIKRIYYIHGAPKGTHRGGHAHNAIPLEAEAVITAASASGWTMAARRPTSCWTAPTRA